MAIAALARRRVAGEAVVSLRGGGKEFVELRRLLRELLAGEALIKEREGRTECFLPSRMA